MAHARDFRWFGEQFESLAEAYCVSFLRGVTAAEALSRFAVGEDRRRLGLGDLEERAYEEIGADAA